MIALLAPAALAAEPEPPARRPVMLVLRGSTERWSDPAIATVYKSGAWMAGVGVVTPVIGPVGVDVEFAFTRLEGGGATLELAPLSALVELTGRMGAVDLFGGIGPTWTLFTERGTGLETVDGARIAGEVRGGLRADTGLVDPPSPPAPAGLVKAVVLEVYVARRSELFGPEGGLALGAWRASVGLGGAF